MTTSRPRIAIIDNYDSYVYNLYQRIGELTGETPFVVRHDAATLAEVAEERPTHIVISPGPGNPENEAYFGICRQVIVSLGKTIPVLGVCLGHQGIGSAFGGRVVRAPKVMHGKTSRVTHDGKAIFRDVENPCVVMRYHSLVVDPQTLPDCLRVTARTDEGIIMGLEHVAYPIYGVQFHPESIGTPAGYTMLKNFLSVSPGRAE